MATIKIEDLPKYARISKEEMMKVFGGGSTLPLPDFWKPHDDYEIGFATHKDSWRGE